MKSYMCWSVLHQKPIPDTFNVIFSGGLRFPLIIFVCSFFFLLPSGVKNADENELKSIASPPEETHVYNVADFSVMSDIVEGLTKTICDRVDQLDKQIKGLSRSDVS